MTDQIEEAIKEAAKEIFASIPVVSSIRERIEAVEGIVKIDMPKDMITDAGIEEIQRWLRHNYYPMLPDNWDWVWVVNKGKYVGTFPKRVANWLFKEHGMKLVPFELSQIGNLAKAHSYGERSYYIDFTFNIDWQSGDFGDSGSCYWSCRSEAIDMLHENGGGAVRLWEKPIHDISVYRYTKDGMVGAGRAWLVPDFPKPGMMVIFNSYPAGFQLINFARILSFYFGLSYQKVSLANNSSTSDTLWINNSSGYVIGEASEIADIQSLDFRWEDLGSHRHECIHCGDYYDEDDMYLIDDDWVCDYCRGEYYSTCEACGGRVHDDDTYSARNLSGYWYTFCESCFDEHAGSCEDCEESYLNEYLNNVRGRTVCDHCMDDYPPCEHCNEEDCKDDMHEIDDGYICNDCWPYFYQCEACGRWDHVNNMEKVGYKHYCPTCIPEEENEEEPA